MSPGENWGREKTKMPLRSGKVCSANLTEFNAAEPLFDRDVEGQNWKFDGRIGVACYLACQKFSSCRLSSHRISTWDIVNGHAFENVSLHIVIAGHFFRWFYTILTILKYTPKFQQSLVFVKNYEYLWWKAETHLSKRWVEWKVMSIRPCN